MAAGTVIWFNSARGFGFIKPKDGGQDVFVHASAVHQAGWRILHDGQSITYDLGQDRQGKTAAVNLKVG